MSLETYDKRISPDFTEKSKKDAEKERQRRLKALSREHRKELKAIRLEMADKAKDEKQRRIQDTMGDRRLTLRAKETRRRPLVFTIPIPGEDRPLSDNDYDRAVERAEQRLEEENRMLEKEIDKEIHAETNKAIDDFLDQVAPERQEGQGTSAHSSSPGEEPTSPLPLSERFRLAREAARERGEDGGRER